MTSFQSASLSADSPAQPLFFPTTLAVGLLVLAKFLVQIGTAGRYGIFRDELYFLACARHLAWGYVDHPPLVDGVVWFAAHVFGTSLFGLRLLPTVAGAAVVWLTAQVARQLGGGRFAQGMAALAVLTVPVYLMLGHWLTMNAFEPLLWTATLWLALRMVAQDNPRYWLAIGAVWGVGMETKYSMVFPAAALVFSLLLTPARRLLANRWFAAGVALAALLFLPNFLWQARHGFPFLEFERHARLDGSRLLRSPLGFVADQCLTMNPLLAPLWMGGLGWLLLSADARNHRFVGWTFLGVFALLLTLGAKNYYAAPAYPALFAAGAVALERGTSARWRWLRTGYAAAVLLSGVVLAPLVLPLLPVRALIGYQRALGGWQPVRFERQASGPLPEQFAGEFGWEDMARETARVFDRLPPAQRATTAIFANDYSEAGAIDFFGPKYGLPPAISNHENYWLWGPRGYTGRSVIVLGSNGEGDREHFTRVESVGRADHPWAREDERFEIYLCQDPRKDLPTLWPSIKKW